MKETISLISFLPKFKLLLWHLVLLLTCGYEVCGFGVWAHTCSLSCLHGLTQHFSISETRPVVQRSSKLQGQSEKPQKRDRVEDGRLMGMDPSLNDQEAFKNVLN